MSSGVFSAKLFDMKRGLIFGLVLLHLFCTSVFLVSAGETDEKSGPMQIRAKILSIKNTAETGETWAYEFSARTSSGQTVEVNTADSFPDGLYFSLKKGDSVFLRSVEEGESEPQIYFEDKIRTPALIWIMVFFAIVTVAVASLRGVWSLLGIGFTLLVLFGFLFPQILAGEDPIFYTLIASLFILAVNIHLSHGFKKRTFFAFLGTVIGLMLVWFLSVLFTHGSSLSGLGSEEVTLLLWDLKQIQDPVSLFIAGVILGAVGVLDDVVVAQAELVEELQASSPLLSRKELYTRAMRVGRHHIASAVNTLVLVYAGAALPLMLLFFSSSDDAFLFLNNEGVAQEAVRILAGTTALILTVPLATLFATIPVAKPSKKD